VAAALAGCASADKTQSEALSAQAGCPATLDIGVVTRLMHLGLPAKQPNLNAPAKQALRCEYPAAYDSGALSGQSHLDETATTALLNDTQSLFDRSASGVFHCEGATAFTLVIVDRGNGRSDNLYYPENGCIAYVAIAGEGIMPLQKFPPEIPERYIPLPGISSQPIGG